MEEYDLHQLLGVVFISSSNLVEVEGSIAGAWREKVYLHVTFV
jgi:hypothetical protein